MTEERKENKGEIKKPRNKKWDKIYEGGKRKKRRKEKLKLRKSKKKRRKMEQTDKGETETGK